ncbi:MAG: hypothetical protein AB7F74_05080 [Parvibaculaceae bacterium]
MSREITRHSDREVADYSPDANDVGFSRGDLVASDKREIGPADTPAQLAADRTAHRACEATLRAHWGEAYQARLDVNLAVLAMEFGPDLAADLLLARLPDGRRIADVPEFSAGLSELIQIAAMGNQQGAGVEALLARKAAIEGVMRTDFGRYRGERLDDELSAILAKMEGQ